MRCIIVYFSQTGNTEKVAGAIQRGVAREAGNCEITRIKGIRPEYLKDFDLIGLGCPIQGFVEPGIIHAYIYKMSGLQGKHVFPFATHGTRPEFFFPSIVPKLERKGLTVIGMFNCYADVEIPSMPRPYPTAGHPDSIDLKEAEEFGNAMVERSRRIRAGETGLLPPLPTWSEYDVENYKLNRAEKEIELGVPGKIARRGQSKITFKYDAQKCTYPSCRLCIENCPMEGIDLSAKPPVIGKPCMQCTACVEICPDKAISLNIEGITLEPSKTVTGKSTDKPGTGFIGSSPVKPIPVDVEKAVFEEFYLKPLEKAEAEGRFRRLVQIKDIIF